ncbi:unnamed protein product [Boreogadus saida]
MQALVTNSIISGGLWPSPTASPGARIHPARPSCQPRPGSAALARASVSPFRPLSAAHYWLVGRWHAAAAEGERIVYFNGASINTAPAPGSALESKIKKFRQQMSPLAGLWCLLKCSEAVRLCYVDDRVSKVAWLNRSNIIFASQDKWSLDPRVDLVTKGQLEYSLRIQKVDVYDEGSYTCSIQTKQQPKTSQVYLIVQGT